MIHDDPAAEIHAYLSGELSADQEQALFRKLSERDDVRAELAAQRKIEDTVARDASMVSIPSETTGRIFQRLGFEVSTVPTTGLEPATGTASVRLWRIVRVPLALTATAAAALTVVYQLATYSPAAPPGLSDTVEHSSVAPASHATDMSVANDDGSVTGPPTENTTDGSDQPSGTLSPTSRRRIAAVEHRASINDPIARAGDAKARSEHDRDSNMHSQDANRWVPNEPYYYLDIGKFSSVDYLTQQKIIGVSDKGKIFYSSDAGKTWVLQVCPTEADLFGVNFIDSLNGIVVGANGTLLRTGTAGWQDGNGAGWYLVPIATHHDLITVRCVSRHTTGINDTVFACGAQGTVMRSIDAGRSWQVQTTPLTARLFRIEFETSTHGFVRGERGITLQTTNAGETWSKQ